MQTTTVTTGPSLGLAMHLKLSKKKKNSKREGKQVKTSQY